MVWIFVLVTYLSGPLEVHAPFPTQQACEEVRAYVQHAAKEFGWTASPCFLVQEGLPRRSTRASREAANPSDCKSDGHGLRRFESSLAHHQTRRMTWTTKS